MNRVRSSIGAILILVAVYAAGVLTEFASRTRPSGPMAVPVPAHASSTALPDSSIPQFAPHDRDVPRRLDLRGNEIARPVARYRLDEHGLLYEVNSPQTEVQRLAPPAL
jgi:hypothetical protein